MRLPSWMRPRHTRRTGTRTVTVEITADIVGFRDAAEKASASMRRINDRGYIQWAAIEERARLAAWWDDHLDRLYADLGMERPR